MNGFETIREIDRYNSKLPYQVDGGDFLFNNGISGSYGNASTYNTKPSLSLEGLDLDALWDRMYTKAKSVIVQCPWCHAHNAISNPTCCQCGGTLS